MKIEEAMDDESKNIYSDFRKLIVESCDFYDVPSRDFQDFHHEFLKFFFGVIKVEINYIEKSIALWSPKPIINVPLNSYNINTCVRGTLSYLDFEATLLGCMEQGQFQLRIYKHLLHDFRPQSLNQIIMTQ